MKDLNENILNNQDSNSSNLDEYSFTVDSQRIIDESNFDNPSQILTNENILEFLALLIETDMELREQI